MRYDISYSSVSIIELCFEAPYVPLRGDSIFRNITSYFLILFMFCFCSFCFTAVQKTSYLLKDHPRNQTKEAHTAACTPSAGCPPLPSATATRLPHPQFCLSWVSRLPPCSLSLIEKRPRKKTDLLTLEKCTQTQELCGKYKLPRCIINSTSSVYRINV